MPLPTLNTSSLNSYLIYANRMCWRPWSSALMEPLISSQPRRPGKIPKIRLAIGLLVVAQKTVPRPKDFGAREKSP